MDNPPHIMTTLLAIGSSKYRINDMLDAYYYCDARITVKALRYKCGNEYYDTTCSYGHACSDSHHLNPFNEGSVSQSEDGDIIKKNPMTEKMVENLLMDEAQLGELTEHMHPADYKAGIMRALSLFWD